MCFFSNANVKCVWAQNKFIRAKQRQHDVYAKKSENCSKAQAPNSHTDSVQLKISLSWLNAEIYCHKLPFPSTLEHVLLLLKYAL